MVSIQTTTTGKPSSELTGLEDRTDLFGGPLITDIKTTLGSPHSGDGLNQVSINTLVLSTDPVESTWTRIGIHENHLFCHTQMIIN